MTAVSPSSCLRSPGYWRNHLDESPLKEVVLGQYAYNVFQLRVLLSTPTRGDASIVLARQLIAAKLDAASTGAALPPVAVLADQELAQFDGALPYGVRAWTYAGGRMLILATWLERWIGTACGKGITERLDSHKFVPKR